MMGNMHVGPGFGSGSLEKGDQFFDQSGNLIGDPLQSSRIRTLAIGVLRVYQALDVCEIALDASQEQIGFCEAALADFDRHQQEAIQQLQNWNPCP